MGRSLRRSIASIITLNLGVGCAPSCWPIFGFRNLLGARRGPEGSFLCSLITDFLAEGAGWGASPGRGGELGCLAQQVLKKNCEIGVGFSFAALSVFRLRRAEAASALWIPHWHSEPCESRASPGRGGELGCLLLRLHKKLPSAPPASTQEVRNCSCAPWVDTLA